MNKLDFSNEASYREYMNMVWASSVVDGYLDLLLLDGASEKIAQLTYGRRKATYNFCLVNCSGELDRLGRKGFFRDVNDFPIESLHPNGRMNIVSQTKLVSDLIREYKHLIEDSTYCKIITVSNKEDSDLPEGFKESTKFYLSKNDINGIKSDQVPSFVLSYLNGLNETSGELIFRTVLKS